jgi:hypothetical protein
MAVGTSSDEPRIYSDTFTARLERGAALPTPLPPPPLPSPHGHPFTRPRTSSFMARSTNCHFSGCGFDASARSPTAGTNVEATSAWAAMPGRSTVAYAELRLASLAPASEPLPDPLLGLTAAVVPNGGLAGEPPATVALALPGDAVEAAPAAPAVVVALAMRRTKAWELSRSNRLRSATRMSPVTLAKTVACREAR